MIVAEAVLRHTRHGSPTRRVALERFAYPETSAPHAPGVLLAGVVAAHLGALDEALRRTYDDLVAALARGEPMPRRALRHRVQSDCVGLDRSEHRLAVDGESPRLDVDHHGPAVPQVVGALMGAAALLGVRRRTAVTLLRRAGDIPWTSGAEVATVLLADADPVALALRHRRSAGPEEERALEALGFGIWETPTRGEVLAAFRRLARAIHPDHGAQARGAGERMSELARARDLLLGVQDGPAPGARG